MYAEAAEASLPPSTTAPTASAARCSPTAAGGARRRGRLHDGRPGVSLLPQDASMPRRSRPIWAWATLFQSGDYANAGTAFRQAAIDGANPAPAAALGELGRCFIARPSGGCRGDLPYGYRLCRSP
ncbi:MAG: hypothetical protein ACLU0O_06710 [Collinsella sp.]